MTRRSTDDLVRDLASGLAQVRPVPRLRILLGGVLGLAFAVGAARLVFGGGLRPDLAALLGSEPRFAAYAGALALAAFGGPLAAAAASVPGRGMAMSMGLLALALATAASLAAVGIDVASGATLRLPQSGDLRCMAGALGVALAPALALLAFVLRAAPRGPLATAVLAPAGAVAFGGLVVHGSCPGLEHAHWWWGHACAPLAAVLLAAPPLAVLLRRRIAFPPGA